MNPAILAAETTVQASIGQARRWFSELQTHPERYQFETHSGFTFTRGNFGEIGGRFQTQEKFCGLKLTLCFELIEVEDSYFRFRLTCPSLPIWGAFTLEEADDEATALRLTIGGTTRLGKWFLRLPMIRGAIQRQIRSEVEHIKVSMEATQAHQQKETER